MVLFLALGSAMIRESGSMMVGQYFKKRREAAEAVLVASSGVGVAAMALVTERLTE